MYGPLTPQLFLRVSEATGLGWGTNNVNILKLCHLQEWLRE